MRMPYWDTRPIVSRYEATPYIVEVKICRSREAKIQKCGKPPCEAVQKLWKKPSLRRKTLTLSVDNSALQWAYCHREKSVLNIEETALSRRAKSELTQDVVVARESELVESEPPNRAEMRVEERSSDEVVAMCISNGLPLGTTRSTVVACSVPSTRVRTSMRTVEFSPPRMTVCTLADASASSVTLSPFVVTPPLEASALVCVMMPETNCSMPGRVRLVSMPGSSIAAYVGSGCTSAARSSM